MKEETTKEQIVLGMMLIPGCFYRKCYSCLTLNVFKIDKHQTIFDAMAGLHLKGEPIDWMTVTSALKETDSLESIGGIDYILFLLKEGERACQR